MRRVGKKRVILGESTVLEIGSCYLPAKGGTSSLPSPGGGTPLESPRWTGASYKWGLVGSFSREGNYRGTEALTQSQGGAFLDMAPWPGSTKERGTGLKISEGSQLDPAMSAEPEGSRVWCVWGVGRVSPCSAMLDDPGRVLRDTPNKD